jgi:uncharacterized protein (TIRG00374 family)
LTLDGWALEDGAPARVNVTTEVPRSRLPLFRIAVSVALVAAAGWALHDVAWDGLRRALSAAGPGWIAAAAVLNLGAVALRAARWQALARPLSPAVTFGAAFRSLTMGYVLSMVLPARAGELLRMETLSRRTGLSEAAVAGSIVLDYLVNAAGLLLSLGLLPLFMEVPGWMRPGAIVAFSLFALGSGLALFLARPSDAAAHAAEGRITGIVRRLRHGLAAGKRPEALAAAFGACLGSWVVEVGVAALTMTAMGVSLPYSAALFVLLAVNLSLAVTVAPPGNVGPVELAATFSLLGLGVAKEQALAFAIVYHALQIVPVALLGIFFASRRLEAPDAA